jgi:hypothetical protein
LKVLSSCAFLSVLISFLFSIGSMQLAPPSKTPP